LNSLGFSSLQSYDYEP